MHSGIEEHVLVEVFEVSWSKSAKTTRHGHRRYLFGQKSIDVCVTWLFNSLFGLKKLVELFVVDPDIHVAGVELVMHSEDVVVWGDNF